MQPRHSTGFTLIELMVVVAIVAILAVMAAPSYRDMIDRFRLRKASEDVVSLISNARAGAVKLHRQVAVGFVTGSGWCVGANAAPEPTGGAQAGTASACACGTPATCSVDGENLVIPAGKHGDVKMTNSPATLVYDGTLGTSVGLATRVVNLESPNGTYSVNVNVTPLGQANACSSGPAMAGFPPC